MKKKEKKMVHLCVGVSGVSHHLFSGSPPLYEAVALSSPLPESSAPSRPAHGSCGSFRSFRFGELIAMEAVLF